ncbi:MAG: thioredoxin family protein [Isosphaeraceae bacterium]|nr:thioredoxin family protein [Isosphaeraceae bacterium]
MKLIHVLGPGCEKCGRLAANAEQAVRDSGCVARVVKVKEISEMLTFDGVSALPALAVDGVVKVCGRVPGVDEIQAMIG